MLVINSILGNAYHGKHLESKIHTAKENNTLKRLFLTRTQMRSITNFFIDNFEYDRLRMP